MKPVIVVEGPSDRVLLESMLHGRAAQVDWRVARGKGSVPSVARTLLGPMQRAVAIVVDADATDPANIEEQKRSFEEALRAAGPSEPYRIVFAVPDLNQDSAAAVVNELNEFLDECDRLEPHR
jgi:predicted ATP-dependent endonuclease of OLD family